MDEGETMVSFDVSSLFTNEPIGEATDIIKDRLEEDENLGDRTPLSPGRVADGWALCSPQQHLPYINFTMELEEDGSIPFLNTRVTRKVKSKQDTTVHHKLTHTDR